MDGGGVDAADDDAEVVDFGDDVELGRWSLGMGSFC